MKWQPIKTAPKDGTRVLLVGFGGSYVYIDCGHYNNAPNIGDYGPWRWPWTVEPTHWMPMPPLPE